MAKQNQLKNPTYCQVEEPSRPDDAEQAIQVLENGLQDLGDRRRRAHLHAWIHMPDSYADCKHGLKSVLTSMSACMLSCGWKQWWMMQFMSR